MSSDEMVERVAVPPHVLAAAWAAWHSRHGGKLGPGSAFAEAISAAIEALSASGVDAGDPRETDVAFLRQRRGDLVRERDAARDAVVDLIEAIGNNGKTTSLHDWNAGMQSAVSRARLAIVFSAHAERRALELAGLTDADRKAQGERCSCRGVDDYCPCQNVPDAAAIRARGR